MAFEWSPYAPAIIITIIIIIAYVVIYTATSPLGWTHYADMASWMLSTTFFLIVGFLVYLAFAFGWTNFNRVTVPGSLFNQVTVGYLILTILSLAWICLYFGDANLEFSFVILIVSFIVSIALMWVARSNVSVLITLGIYSLWLIYLITVNGYAMIKNNIVHPSQQRCPLHWS